MIILASISYSIDVTECQAITANGTYNLTSPLSGANISASPVAGVACIKIASSNVSLDCNGFNITNNGTANAIGILLNGSITNVTVKNCPQIYGYSNGVYLNTGSNGNTIANNTVINSTTTGYLIQGSNGNNLTNNTFINSTATSGVGFAVNSGSNNVLINNTAIKANCQGFSLSSSGNNNLTGNIAINTSSGCSAPSAFSLAFSSLNNLVNNTAINSSNGFSLSFSGDNNNNLTNNTVINAGLGFVITSSTSNRLSNNTVTSSNIGYEIASASGVNTLNNNTATNSNIGFFLASSPAGTLTNNTAINSSIHGFALNTSSNIILTNNTAINSASHGFDFTSSGSNNISNNTATNSGIGFFVNVSIATPLINNFTGNTVSNSSSSGMSISGNNTRLNNDHFYNNNPDFTIIGNGTVVNLTSVIFDNPSGNFSNYTNLSINDTLAGVSSYSINWSPQPATPPAGFASFANKFLNITNTSGSVSIDKVTWRWVTGELSGVSESNLQLWVFNSTGWATLNTTPNTAAHTLSQANLTPSSVYAILEFVSCPVITSPGSYLLSNNTIGAPNDASPLSGSACVKIASSNVVFSCNGFNITNNETGTTYGILLSGPVTNISIRNCNVSNYTYGVYLSQSNRTNVTNSTMFNNALGVYVLDSNTSNVSLSRFYNNSLDYQINNTGSLPIRSGMRNAIFDNPSGNLSNFSNLTLSDSVSAGSSYSINWSAQPPVPFPSALTPFNGKFVNISSQAGAVSIDSISWTWVDPEVSVPLEENRFELWKLNSSGWIVQNFTPDVSANEISLANLNTTSVFGILNNDCPIISAPGSYQLTKNLVGAPNFAPATAPFTMDGFACVMINSANVDFDCAGLNITGRGGLSPYFYGVFINATAGNVTIRNCPNILNYTAGIYALNSSGVLIVNSTSHHNSGPGILFDNVSDSGIVNVTAFNNSATYTYGNIVISGDGNTIVNNTAFSLGGAGNPGFALDGGSSNNTFMNNIAFNNSFNFALDAFLTSGESRDNNTIVNNSASFGTVGFTLTGANNLIANNTAFNQTFGPGFRLIGGTNNTVIGNAAFDQSIGISAHGFEFDQANSTTIINNTAYNNSGDGFRFNGNVLGGNDNLVANNSAQDNAGTGFIFSSSNNNTVTNNAAINDSAGIDDSGPSDSNRFVNNRAIGCFNGIGSVGSNSIFINNTVLNSNLGYSIGFGNNITVINNLANNSDFRGFSFDSASNSTIANNTAVNSSFDGFGFFDSLSTGSNTSVVNNTADGGTNGFGVSGVINYTFRDNLASNNSYGFQISSKNSSFINNSAHDNAVGFDFSSTFFPIPAGNVLVDSTAFNDGVGTLLGDVNQTLFINPHFYNNSVDFSIASFSAAGISFNLSGAVFDNPSGNFQNYTNLSINDTLSPVFSNDTSYNISYATTGHVALPSGQKSFAGKFIDITNTSENVSIDSIAWTWTDSEIGGNDTESDFRLWKFNMTDGWKVINGTPDTVGDTLSLSGYAPGSIHAIFQNGTAPVPDCPIIGFPGVYQMGVNSVGAPNPGPSCIFFITPDSSLDCAGFNLTDNATSGSMGALIDSKTNVTLRNCIIYGYNHSGIELTNSNQSALINNVIRRSGELFSGGAHISASNGNLIENNTARDDIINGFLIEVSNNNTLRNNSAINNSGSTGGGFTQSDAHNNTYIGNAAMNNSESGFLSGLANNTRFIDNVASGNAFEGFDVSDCFNTTFNNNTVFGNGENGFHIDPGDRLTAMSGNTVFGHPVNGVYITSNGTISADHYFNNGRDLRIEAPAGGLDISLSYVVFDNPSGSIQNFTNLSLNDTLTALSVYTIDHSAQPAILPLGVASFAERYVNITRVSGTVSIDSIAWHWRDAELGVLDSESEFRLYKYNSTGWVVVNATPDTAGNTLSLTAHSPASVYAILENGTAVLPNCPVISSPGAFTMTGNSVGSPNPASPIAGTTCVLITSSNVVFDCDGFNISNNGTAGATHGVAVSNSISNVTVKNCNIRNYDTAIQTLSLNNSAFRNNSMSNDSKGIVITSSNNNSISNNSISTAGASAGNHGVQLVNSSNNAITNNTIAANGSSSGNMGVSLESSSNRNNVTNNTITVNGTSGNNGARLLTSANDNNITGNQINTNGSSNGNSGITVTSSLRTLIRGNIITPDGVSDSHGVLFQTASTNSTVVNNTIVAPKGVGVFLLDNTNHTNVSQNAILNASTGISIQCGSASTSTANNTVADNRIESNGTSGSNHGILLWMQATCSILNNTISRNNVSARNGTGIYIIGANRTMIFENNVTTPLNNHCMVLQTSASDNNVSGNLLESCGAGGIVIVTLSNNNNIINNTVNFAGLAALADGFSLTGVSNNTLAGNTVHNASDDGFQVSTNANNTNLTGNTAHNVVAEGFESSLNSNNTFTGNVAYNCGMGFIIFNATNVTLRNSTAHGCVRGFDVQTNSFNNTLLDSIAFNNSIGTDVVNSSGTQLTDTHLYNNTQDLHVNGGGVINISRALFDNPSGSIQNFTNLSINDSGTMNYSITHSVEPLTAPPGPSFAQKYVNITNLSPGIIIDSITWRWLDSELGGGDNESAFELWRFDSSWNQASASPDTVSNRFALSNLNSFGVYGIIQNVSVNLTENLTVTKADSTLQNASPGGIASFNITVNNTGNASISPTVVDVLPAGLTFSSTSPANSSGSGNTVTWNLPAISPGSFTVILLNATVDPGVVAVANLTNFVNATTGNVTGNATANATVYYANLSVVKMDQTVLPVSPGGIVQFNITVNNTGNVTLNPVRVVDTLPPGLTFASASPSISSLVGQVVAWNSVGSLAPGASVVLRMNATANPGVVDAGTPLLNLTNSVNATGVPPNGFNVTANNTTNVTVSYANISAVKTVVTPAPFSPGGSVLWQINITNPGQTVLDPVFVSDTLPSGLQISAPGSSPSPDSISPDNRTMNWTNVGPIAPGASVVILINSTIGSVVPGTYANNATARGSPPNGNPVTASSNSSIGVGVAAITIVKTVSPLSVQNGSNVTFTVNITNTGSVPLNISATDQLPPNNTFQSANIAPLVSGSNLTGQNLTWTNFITLNASNSTILVFNVSVDTAGLYSNLVNVTGVPVNGANAAASGTAFFSGFVPGAPSSGGGGGGHVSPPLVITVDNSCDGANITVTSGGSPVSGAHVTVQDNAGNSVYVNDTGADGKVPFMRGATTYTIHASESGYSPAVLVTEAGRLACIQADQCISDANCASNERCINPQAEGSRFGPQSTYRIAPAFAACLDDQIANEVDQDEFFCPSSTIPDSVTIPGLDSGSVIFRSFIALGPEDCGNIIDKSYCRICSSKCTAQSDCRLGTYCIHQSLDFVNVNIGQGRCSIQPAPTSCSSTSDCEDENQICDLPLSLPGTQVNGTCRIKSCTEDSNCSTGSYCEPAYGVCLRGCNQGHENNCGLGSICYIEEDSVLNYPRPLATINGCLKGCRSDSDCGHFQFCDFSVVGPRIGLGRCNNVGCGELDPAGHKFADPATPRPSDPWECDSGILARGAQSNPACKDCNLEYPDSGKICINHQCAVPGCTSNSNCTGGQVCNLTTYQCEALGACARPAAAPPSCGRTSPADCACPSGQGCIGGACSAVTPCSSDSDCGSSQSCQPLGDVKRCASCAASITRSGYTDMLISVKCDGNACPNCDVTVTDPAGTSTTIKTSSDGTVTYTPAGGSGSYSASVGSPGHSAPPATTPYSALPPGCPGLPVILASIFAAHFFLGRRK
ncbi:MAG: right-handed parallel beta-helix repeat-containing protein [Candidatus Micrarchaeia archaeon]